MKTEKSKSARDRIYYAHELTTKFDKNILHFNDAKKIKKLFWLHINSFLNDFVMKINNVAHFHTTVCMLVFGR